MTTRHTVAHPLVLRQAQVVRVRDITLRMRRITLAGPQLGAFSRDGLEFPAFRTPGFDDHIKLLFASDDDIRSVLPTQLADGIDWAPSENRQGRDYTPRRFDPIAGELDLDFVLHGHGPAASWAQGAQIGDDLWFVGPKSSVIVPEDTGWVLLCGDETALPAIGRFLEERPVTAPVRAVITISHPEARQELPWRDADEVQWIIAGSADAEALSEAATAVTPLPGPAYVWAAAESRALLPLRRHAVRVLGADKAHTNITGYWHIRTGQDEAPSPSPFVWFAIRAGLRMGIVDAVADGPRTSEQIGRELQIDARIVGTVVDALVSADVIAAADSSTALLTLGAAGRELVGDEHLREGYDGLAADELLSLALLPEAAERNMSAWSLQHGGTLSSQAAQDTRLYAEFIEEAEGLSLLMTGLHRLPLWKGAARIGITGPGALPVAEALRIDGITIVEDTGPLSMIRAAAGDDSPLAFRSEWEPVDIAVTAHALWHRSDAECARLLTGLRRVAHTALLVERLAPDGLSPVAVSEKSLRRLATAGDPPLDHDRLTAIAAESGWRIDARHGLGWGIEALTLRALETAE